MRVIFLPGGSVNEYGPFQPGAEVRLPDDIATDLIKKGLATAIEKASNKPLTITVKNIKVQGALDV